MFFLMISFIAFINCLFNIYCIKKGILVLHLKSNQCSIQNSTKEQLNIYQRKCINIKIRYLITNT